MKRTVTITIQVDATEYHEIEDTAEGTVDLVIDMLRGDADLPEVTSIICEDISRSTGDHLTQHTQYIVIDSGKLAQYPEVKADPSWDNCKFSSFEKALAYTKNWLGRYCDNVFDGWDGSPLDYNGYGNTISIVKVVNES